MQLLEERILGFSALCSELPSCQAGNAWKQVIAARHLCKRYLSLKNHQLSSLNRFLWVKMKISRTNNRLVCLNYLEMSSLNQVWRNSKLRHRRWISHYLVAPQIFLPFHWSHLIQQRFFQALSKSRVNLRNKRKVHNYNSSPKPLSSNCQRLSLSPILRRFFRERSSTWKL